MAKETLALWWVQNWPHANIGIATGAGSDLFMIDVDGEAGALPLQVLEEQYGTLPEAVKAVTGRGQHLYFKYPGNRGRTTAAALGPGLDTRGDGGYSHIRLAAKREAVEYLSMADERGISRAVPPIVPPV